MGGSTTKSAELQRVFGSASSAQRTLANDMWNTCQAHAGQNPNHVQPWHRVFVYYDAEFHDHGQSELGEAPGEDFYSFDVTGHPERLAHAGATRRDMPIGLVVGPGGRTARCAADDRNRPARVAMT